MDNDKRIKTRFIIRVTIGVIGLLLIILGLITKNDILSPYGFGLFVIGVVQSIRDVRLMKNKEKLDKRMIAETDERNIMLWTKARSMTLSIYIYLSAIAVIVFYAVGLDVVGKIIACNLFSIVLIYWICYLIIMRKN